MVTQFFQTKLRRLQCLIMDISPNANLDKIFRPLENSHTSEMLLSKEKARLVFECTLISKEVYYED